MKNFSSVCWGVLLIVFGIVLGGNALNIWDIDIFFPGWWTLFLIVPSLFSILRSGFRWGNSVILIIGLGALVSSWNIISWGTLWSLMIPGFLVAVGLCVLFGIGRTKRHTQHSQEYTEGDTSTGYSQNEGGYDSVNAFLSGAERHVVNEVYCGGKVSAVLGSSVLDLRCAVIEQDIYIKVDVFMGGAEIYFPPGVRVLVDGSPFLGGIENKVNQCMAVNCPTVHLDCSAVLGGIELR